MGEEKKPKKQPPNVPEWIIALSTLLMAVATLIESLR